MQLFRKHENYNFLFEHASELTRNIANQGFSTCLWGVILDVPFFAMVKQFSAPDWGDQPHFSWVPTSSAE